MRWPRTASASARGLVALRGGAADRRAAWSPESWRRDHTLRSAMHHSVVWYFQRIAERLGASRESEYLRRLS
ncbi:MAG: penicillin-binding transpeptidase domain-containing protein [Gammaproteobacteria bacterium]